MSRYTCPSARVFILNLDTRWLHTPGALPPPPPKKKEPRYPLNRGLGGPQSRSEKEKKCLHPWRISTSGSWVGIDLFRNY